MEAVKQVGVIDMLVPHPHPLKPRECSLKSGLMEHVCCLAP